MTNEFKLYAVYDRVKDGLRSDLVSKHKKYWESVARAQAAINFHTRCYNSDPDRFKVVEIDCQVNVNEI